VTRRLRIAVALSGLGHLIHNLEEFGLTILMVGQTVVPAVVTAILFVAVRRPTRTILRLAGVWAVVVIVVGGGSVLPLPFLPFTPAQTVSHYLTHLVYALLQLPLLVLAWTGRTRSGGGPADRYTAETV
jgi:hypothetical protein